MRNQVALPSQLVMLRRALDEHCSDAKIAADSPLRDDIATRLMLFFQSGVSDLDELKAMLRADRIM